MLLDDQTGVPGKVMLLSEESETTYEATVLLTEAREPSAVENDDPEKAVVLSGETVPEGELETSD